MSRTAEPGLRPSKQRRNLLIVVAFVCFLVIQGFFSFRVSPEPYPIIRMPGFQTAANSDGTVGATFVDAEVDLADGTSTPIDPSALMEPLRFSTAGPTLDYILGPKAETTLSEESISWLRDRARIVSGREDVTGIRLCWVSTTISIEDARVVESQPCAWKTVAL
ncbi:hypothetical protein AB0O16_01145 [Microbacterium sp. NPDC089180]|uniref:Uncharacterized protein n=1 Tax=Microbacterium galbum TaxID=3075994 RepID=A0ABU3T4U5_9MICO|nr:hypothetical protein [Microbacterium sp. KSW4-17]MDU0366399.1 hypothetical protein [Microbacterium sp. KSW4-17]